MIHRHRTPVLLLLAAWMVATPMGRPCPAQDATANQEPPAAQPANEQLEDAAPEKVRFFEHDPPYDEIDLRESGETIRVERLPFREIPADSRPTDKWDVVLIDRQDDDFVLTRKDVAEVRFWEQLVLDEALKLLDGDDKDFDEAYFYFDYLLQFYPGWPGVEEGYQRFLYLDAGDRFEKQQPDYALALLTEVHARNPQYPGLEAATGRMIGALVEAELAKEQYSAARRLLRRLRRMYPEHAVANKYETQISEQAAGISSQAAAEREAGRLKEAYDLALRAFTIWPKLESNRQLLEAIQAEYSRVVVGVRVPLGAELTDRLDDWASRRDRRLLARGLQEFIGHGPQGGEYSSPFGRITRLDLDLKVLIDLNQGIPWSRGGELNGLDVARSLLNMADRGHASYRADWGAVFAGVTVRDVYHVEVDLRRGHVRPEALLQAGFAPWNYAPSPGQQPPTLGPYSLGGRESEAQEFLHNERYFAAGPRQPKEIVATHLPDAREGLTALKRGDVAVLDRLFPWEVADLRTDGNVRVAEYAIPTLCCLLPNPDRPFAANRTFRRAMVYGINRSKILVEQLFQGDVPAGSRLVSGPFLAGQTEDDPLGYAYNDSIRVKPYDARQALTLATIALLQINAVRKERAEEPLKEVPPIVLAHPPHELARVVCRTIQQHLKIIKVNVELVETALDPSTPLPEYDFLYADVAMWEPVIDARRLLGEGGLVRRCSSHMDLALRNLDEADSWKTVREQLLEVHRACDADAAIIPLFQLTEHFAYSRTLAGLGDKPVSLYQFIENWELAPLDLVEAE